MKNAKDSRRMVLVILGIYLVIVIGTIASLRISALPKPTLKTMTNGQWSAELETYFQEHIGFRNVLFRIKSRTDLLVGEKMVQGIYVTDDMLLEKIDSSGWCTPEDAASPVNAFYNGTGLPTYLVLVPAASEVYESALPANAVNAEQLTGIRQIYRATAAGVRCVDAYSILSALKERYIYYRTDTRWTSYGAYYVYQAAIQKMGFTPIPYQRYVITHKSTEFRGDLYTRCLYDGVKSDVLDCWSNESGARITSVTAFDRIGRSQERGTQLYDTDALESEDMYRFYLGEPCYKLVIRTNLDNGRRLLLYKDDYADCMLPFLLEHYSEICVVNLDMTGRDFTAAADPAGYTQALFLCSMQKWEQICK